MFLQDEHSRPVDLQLKDLPCKGRLFLGRGSGALEVVAVEVSFRPSVKDILKCWKDRQAGRPAPVLLVVLVSQQAWVCGPVGLEPPVYEEVETSQLERICRTALRCTSPHAAVRLLTAVLPQLKTPLAGVVNRGLLSDHVLQDILPKKPEWPAACKAAVPALQANSGNILQLLGFTIKSHDRLTSILEAQNRNVAVAVLLQPDESPDQNLSRFNGFSPVSYAINVADRENLRFVILVQNRMLRLYPANIGMGVGQRGRTETYIELHLDLLRQDQAGYLWTLFSGEALAPGGFFDQLLKESQRFAGDLAENFRERIYREVVPRLAQGLATARHGTARPTRNDLTETYQIALTILFRLLFIAYAEDKDLLPYEWNASYRKRSLKGLAEELAHKVRSVGGLGCVDQIQWDPNSKALWEQVKQLFSAVEKGHLTWGVPAYDGRLFSSDPTVSPVGQIIASLNLPDTLFAPVLCHLLLVGTSQGVGPVDFRSLSVREFGTIYEGLLESELSCAEQELVVDEKNGQYRPLSAKEIKQKKTPDIRSGQIYLHNRSGARKSTGSYYTKSFAVEYLLDEALEPALKRHLESLDQLDEETAAQRFFEFRVADIAMGSGHFLVAAVDRIERAFSRYLSARRLPAVRLELEKLRTAALNELRKVGLEETLGPKIEDNQLLRRLIARRCIYGVDLNPLAVDLARLSVWIHTFVPGLPLSFLEHHLVVGNSLTGIATWQEVRDQFGSQPLFVDPKKILGQAQPDLERLASLADLTPQDLGTARQAYQQALQKIRPAEALCDLAAAARLDSQLAGDAQTALQNWPAIHNTLFQSPLHKKACQLLQSLRPLHFPVAFPEVFLGEKPGFQVILGNPPWEKPRVEEHAFWARYDPGLRGLNQRAQEKRKEELRKTRPDLVKLYETEVADAEALRRALVVGPYPGMGTGDPDLYKAFCWRFWHLVNHQGGRIGVVLPRSVWSAKGSEFFRREVFHNSRTISVCFLLNKGQWVFDDAEPRYTIALTAIERAVGQTAQLALRGPFDSLLAFQSGRQHPPAIVNAADVESWTDAAALPLLPTEMSLEIFLLMRKHPRLDSDTASSWRARPHRELDATNDKSLMDVKSQSCPKGYWPVMKGESFDLWQPDRGPDYYYAWADPKKVIPHLQAKRQRAAQNRNSPFAEFQARWINAAKTLPCLGPRIAFRDVARATDSRTVRAALVPPRVFLTHKAPYFLWACGDASDQAYLLGILSSLILDWYARRIVETNLTFYVLTAFPIPRPGRESRLWQRVVELAGRLAAVDKRLARWAKQVGVACGPIDQPTWWDVICELDAVVAHLYGLEEKHLIHIFETFHTGWEPGQTADHPTLGDYASRLERTLEWFRHWEKK